MLHMYLLLSVIITIKFGENFYFGEYGLKNLHYILYKNLYVYIRIYDFGKEIEF